jgi:hypothetical protein
MDDRSYQIKNIEYIFSTSSLAPVFKLNPKYSIGDLAGLTPYIAYDDVMSYNYIIRGRALQEPINNFDNEKRIVIAEYDSIESMVDDGWRLD